MALQTIPDTVEARTGRLASRQAAGIVVSDEVQDELDWQDMSLSAFEKDWDNPEDAIYDNWRDIYGVPARSGA